MIICSCRGLKDRFGKEAAVNDSALRIHVTRNPEDLKKNWDEVSQAMTGCEMNCRQCESLGDEMLQWLRDEAEVEGLTAPQTSAQASVSASVSGVLQVSIPA